MKKELVPDGSSITKSDGHKIPHNKINNYPLANDLTFLIPKNKNSESVAGMKGNIQEASFMETGIDLPNPIPM